MARITNMASGKVQDKGIAYVVSEFTSFELALYGACRAIEEAEFTADSKRSAIIDLVRTEYGTTPPTFVQYRDMQDAMRLQALADGFTGQAMRKHVAAAVKQLYGSLPVSDSPAAQLKAKARAIKSAIAKKNEPAKVVITGAPMAHRPGAAETIEQFIARIGVAATLEALARILETEKAIVLDAVTLRAVAGHVKAA